MFSTQRRLTAWFVALGAVAAVGALALIRVQALDAADQAVAQTLAVERAISDTMSSLKDAETGQRGYLLTGDSAFLEPYERARQLLPMQLARLSEATAWDRQQADSARRVEHLATEKLTRLAETIDLYASGNQEEALARVRQGRGNRLMAAMRAESNDMLTLALDRLAQRKAVARAERDRLTYLLYGAALLLVGIAAGGVWSSGRGIAEAKRTTTRLQQSEQALQSLADNTTELVRVIDHDGQLRYVSPSCQALLGFSREEMLAMPPRALLAQDEQTEAYRLTEEAFAGGPTDAPFIHSLARKDGSRRWFETKYRLFVDAKDGGNRIQLTSRDISERKAAEDALRRQTRRLESILSSMGDGVVVADEDRNVLYVNPVASRYIRQGVGEPITSDWVQRHNARELDGVTPFLPAQGPLTRALNGETVDGLGLILQDKQGQPCAFSVTARPITDGAVSAGCVAVYRDISEQRRAKQELEESEQRLRVLSQASFEGIVITQNRVVVDANATFAAWFGHTPESIVGLPGLSLFAPEDHDHVREQSRLPDVVYEAHMLRPDQSRFPVEVRGRNATFRGAPVRIAVIRDVTEKKRHEAELLHHAEQLRALSLRDELTGLFNRRGFSEHGEQQLRGVARAKRTACVFFIDLNDMKIVNDTFGHDAGDRALIATAQLLLGAFRESDIVARLGGDEFAVFAQECGTHDIAALRKRLRERTLEFNEQSGEPFQLSLSVGTAHFEPGQGAGLDALIEAADQAMYKEKRAMKRAAKELAARRHAERRSRPGRSVASTRG